MIFLELALQNFGSYAGHHRLNLRPEANSPIILIGGLNGGGKTTLMDAIRLVLYGQRAQCSNRGSLAYADFLNQCRSRTASDTPTRLELTLNQTLNNAPYPTEFRIRRTWEQLPKNGRDTLEVWQDGELAEDLIQGWDERIETLLPLGISNLFLFDGEQVKDLADQTDLPIGVVQAMRTLLGLELPERLDADLAVLMARKRKQLAKADELSQIEAIEARLEAQLTARRQAKQTLAHLTNQVERAANALQIAQDRFLAEGGKIAAEQAQLIAQRQHLETQRDQHRQALRDLAAAALPLAGLLPLLQQAQAQAQAEVQHQQNIQAQTVLAEYNQAVLAFAQAKFAPQQVEQLAQFLGDRTAALTPDPTFTYLGVDQPQLQALTQVLQHTLPAQHQQAQQQLRQAQQRQAEIDALDRYLQSAAPDETYAQLSADVQRAQDKLAQLKADFAQAERHYHQAQQAIDRTKADLKTYSQLAIDLKNTDHLLQTAAKVQATLATFKQRLKLHKLNYLEERVTKHFLYLLRKPDWVHRVQIDTDSFRLTLYDAKGDSLPKHRLSAGEKQLLAIALLWGLANASGRQLPVAIDTPLGRLDSDHRRHLVERYFPQASHQVILLSTDTEIRSEEVNGLRAQSAIAREYLLEYDAGSYSTVIRKGYFE